MQNKKKSLIITLAVVVALSLMLTLLVVFDDKSADTLSVESKPTIMVLENASDLSSISINNQTGSYTVRPPIDATAQDKVWEIEELSGIPQFQTKYNDLAQGMKALSATEQLKKPGELSIYGLENPETTVVAAYADGTEATLLIGNKTADEAGYYCKLDGQNTIYIISSTDGQKFFRDMLSFVDLELVPTVQTTQTSKDSEGNETTTDLVGVESVRITRNDQSEPIVIERKYDETNPDDLSLTTLWMVSPTNKKLDRTTADTLTASISAFSATQTMAINPTDAQLTEYGFDHPTATIDYVINGTNYTLMVGKGIEYIPGEDEVQVGGIGSYYIMIDGRPVVYTIESGSLATWLKVAY